MRLNFELNLLAHCTQTASQLAAMLAKDFSDSTEMHLADFSNRPLGQRLLEATLRPLAPLL
jgi:phosphatidylserine/phosphatidylglycerophosphate/cardiolipin synthase-like enzyme